MNRNTRFLAIPLVLLAGSAMAQSVPQPAQNDPLLQALTQDFQARQVADQHFMNDVSTLLSEHQKNVVDAAALAAYWKSYVAGLHDKPVKPVK